MTEREPHEPLKAPKRRPRRKKKRVLSPAQIAANRVRSWKHGRKAKTVTPYEGRMAQLRKIHPELPEIIAATVAAGAGNLEKLQQLGLQALAEMEVLRRMSVARIYEDGVVVEDHTITREGEVVGTRKKAHPLLETTQKFHDTLGFTAEQMELTAKAQGQGQKDAAMTAYLDRMAMLRSAPKGRMVAPARRALAEPIDVTPEK